MSFAETHMNKQFGELSPSSPSSSPWQQLRRFANILDSFTDAELDTAAATPRTAVAAAVKATTEATVASEHGDKLAGGVSATRVAKMARGSGCSEREVVALLEAHQTIIKANAAAVAARQNSGD
mmetsp:Transcript_15714/g.31426  ORF Transcript_15714/g.31426 Transcript_15714/m.31426 type:complete len:124 (+) Transcript_15714:779-1150(+)